MINKSQGESGGRAAFGLGGARPLWLLREEQREREKGRMPNDGSPLAAHQCTAQWGGGRPRCCCWFGWATSCCRDAGKRKTQNWTRKTGKSCTKWFFLGWMRKAILFRAKIGRMEKSLGRPFSFVIRRSHRQKKGITRGRGDRRPQLDPWDETTQGCVCTGGRGLLRNKNIHKESEMDV